MSETREVKITNDPFSHWANNMKDVVRTNTLTKTQDYLIEKGPGGTHLNLHPKHKYQPIGLNYVGAWNPISSYSVNDVVTVLDEIPTPTTKIESMLSDFLNGTLTTVNESYGKAWKGLYTSPYTGNTKIVKIPKYLPIAGTYVCVSHVPRLDVEYELELAGLINPNNISNLPPALVNYIRVATVNITVNNKAKLWPICYFPVWPKQVPDHSIVAARYNPNNLIELAGPYWQLLSLLPTVSKGCINGKATFRFTDTQEQPASGSFINDTSL